MGIRHEGKPEAAGEAIGVHSLIDMVRHQAHYLPDQGPISTFIHHNTLHAFEHLEFHEAINESARTHGSHGYLPQEFFLEKFAQGEIVERDLQEALEIRPLFHDLRIGSINLARLRRGFLFSPVPKIAPLARTWYLTKGPEASKTLAALYQEVARLDWGNLGTADHARQKWAKTPIMGLVGQVIGGMLFQDVRRTIAQLAAPFLDRGAVIHSLPGRRGGFFRFALSLLAQTPHVEPWLVRVASVARVALQTGESPAAFAGRCLDWQQPDKTHHESLILATLLAHPGWAGMFWRLERYPQERPDDFLPIDIVDYLAIQLLLEKAICMQRSAERFGSEPLEAPGVLREKLSERLLDPKKIQPLPEQAWNLTFALTHAGESPSSVRSLSECEKSELMHAATLLAGNGKLSIWQEAFEASYRRTIMGGLAVRSRHPFPAPQPLMQVLTCLDDREESLRRALEEASPTVETFGVAGFFGIPVQFTPLGHAKAVDLCPVNVKAVHRVRETVAGQPSGVRYLRNQQISRVMKRMEIASRVGVSGSLFGGLLGLLIYPAMVVGLWFPRLGEKFGSIPARWARGGIRTRLEFEEDPSGIGAFSVTDQVARVAGLLENAGLTKHFAPLVVLMGHGSSSVNNPHKSAYDCGACGGKEGAASARIFANLINRPDVRRGLAARGISIPDSTVFVGSIHDTANDSIILHEGDIPAHAPNTEKVHQLIDEAKRLFRIASRENARERCRRLHSAPRLPTPSEALRHVQGRSLDLGQPRPELGHATNGLTIIGRRSLSRGLFLDRRSFLISYDPETDPKGAILERMIAAVGPVVAGISLEYYFSRVDNEVFGCGTKLPHNPVGLVGVQEGAAGDLRTGLPRQMIEIHPPLRLSVVLETTREIVDGILQRQAEVARLVNNGWIRVVVVEPNRSAAWLLIPHLGYRPIEAWADAEIGAEIGAPNSDLAATPPTVPNSPAWFAGHMWDLTPAIIQPQSAPSPQTSAGSAFAEAKLTQSRLAESILAESGRA